MEASKQCMHLVSQNTHTHTKTYKMSDTQSQVCLVSIHGLWPLIQQ